MSKSRPRIDMFGSVKTDQVLATLTGDHNGRSPALTPTSISSDEKTVLETKIKELTTQLSQQQGVAHLAFDQISRNPLNPRIIFPSLELQSFAEILQEQGQLEPGAVIEMTDTIRSQLKEYADQGLFDPEQPLFDVNLPYLLFNGERRWRSGPLAGLSKFMTVILPSTIATDLLDMQAKAAATSIFQKKLHPLEMGQFLITQINYHYPYLAEQLEELPSIVYPRVLNSLIVRLQRDDKRTGSQQLTEMNQLATASREKQLNWLNRLENDVERAILDVLFRHQQKPSTVNRHVFPLLKLPDDLKQAIYEAGLEPDKIDELKKLNAKSLNLSEAQAIALRSEAIRATISQRWDKQAIAQRVAEMLANHQSPTRSFNPIKLPTAFSSLEKVNLRELEPEQLQLCQQILEKRLIEVRGMLKKRASSSN